MNLRMKILEKEAWLETSQEAGAVVVMKMWIELVSDILYVKSNKLLIVVDKGRYLTRGTVEPASSPHRTGCQ